MPLEGFLLVGASLCGGWSYAYLRRFFQAVVQQIGGLRINDDEVYRRMNELAATSLPLVGGAASRLLDFREAEAIRLDAVRFSASIQIT